MQSCCRNRVWNHLFDYNLNGQQCEMVFAAVAGHLQSLDFTEQHKKWHSCSPVELYTAPVVKFVPEVSEADADNIQSDLTQYHKILVYIAKASLLRPGATQGQSTAGQEGPPTQLGTTSSAVSVACPMA